MFLDARQPLCSILYGVAAAERQAHFELDAPAPGMGSPGAVPGTLFISPAPNTLMLLGKRGGGRAPFSPITPLHTLSTQGCPASMAGWWGAVPPTAKFTRQVGAFRCPLWSLLLRCSCVSACHYSHSTATVHGELEKVRLLCLWLPTPILGYSFCSK